MLNVESALADAFPCDPDHWEPERNPFGCTSQSTGRVPVLDPARKASDEGICISAGLRGVLHVT